MKSGFHIPELAEKGDYCNAVLLLHSHLLLFVFYYYSGMYKKQTLES